MVPPHSQLAEGADPDAPESYADFSLTDFAPDLMHQEALNFIEQNRERPFFLYYASPVPHLPLQAPGRWVDYYRKKLGEEKPFIKGSYFPNQTPRATYAAMISYLDEQVGDLVRKLKETGAYENTLIIFTSDNGPTYTGGVDALFFDSAKPFKSEYGWGKGFVHEGGIRVPMIASWANKIKPGSESHHISAFYDVLPTFCDILDIPRPGNTDGISFLPALLGKAQEQHEYLYWEFPANTGQQAVRMANWKAIRKNLFEGEMDIALYDLETDPREQNNVAAQHPEVIRQMEAIMKKARATPRIETFKMAALGDTGLEE